MASEPAGEKIASRVHDGRRQVIRQRHYTLLVSLAAHDQRMADTVCHHVIAVHGGYLATSQSALRAETDHEPFRRRGHLHRRANVFVWAWPRMRARLLHSRHIETRIVVPSAALAQPTEKRRYRVPVRLEGLRFPLLFREHMHDAFRGHVFGTIWHEQCR